MVRNGGVDEDLGALATVLRVAQPERMRVPGHERAYLAVGRPGTDRDFFALGETPASDEEQQRLQPVLSRRLA